MLGGLESRIVSLNRDGSVIKLLRLSRRLSLQGLSLQKQGPRTETKAESWAGRMYGIDCTQQSDIFEFGTRLRGSSSCGLSTRCAARKLRRAKEFRIPLNRLQ